MLISLKQTEIETALKSHVSETMAGLDLSVYDVNIKLIAGRSGNGLRAEIDLVPLGTTAPEVNEATENDAPTPAAEASEESEEQVVELFDFDDD